MRRTVYGLVLAALFGLGLPAAVAADSYEGGCTFESAHGDTVSQPDEWAGAIHGSVVAVDDVTLAPLPIDVTCWIQVNGVAQLETMLTFSGTGAAADAKDVTYVAADDDTVVVCSDITYGSSREANCVAPSPTGAPAEPPVVSSAVVGYVQILQEGDGAPTFTTWGALADPTSWTCSDNGTARPYAVSCVPMAGVVGEWRCDVLHADVWTVSAGAVARTALDCDGAGGPEAETDIASGVGSFERVFAPSSALVTAFTCTVDDGAGGAALPAFGAGCGDPGAPTVR